MKKLGFLFLYSILLFSCKQEDGIFLSGTPSRTELDIKKIIEITYKNGDPSAYKVTMFNNRRLLIDSFYNKNRELTGFKKWNYTNDSLLVNVKTYDSLQALITEKTRNLFYNNDKKIDTITTTNDTLAFNYDVENLIIATKLKNGILTKDSLATDLNKQIYTTANGLFKTELSLGSSSVIDLKTTDLTTSIDTLFINYNYNIIIQPKGFLWKDTMLRTFTNTNNAVLFYSLYDAYKIYGAHYTSHIVANGIQTIYSYTLDDEGYLTKSQTTVNNDVRTIRTYFYE